MLRRAFLRWIGLGGAVVTVPKTHVEAAAKVSVKPPEVGTSASWKFHPYLSPNLVGYKGYWYVPYEHEYMYEDGKKRHRTTQDIMAFETLEGKIIASPWAIQVTDYYNRTLPS